MKSDLPTSGSTSFSAIAAGDRMPPGDRRRTMSRHEAPRQQHRPRWSITKLDTEPARITSPRARSRRHLRSRVRARPPAASVETDLLEARIRLAVGDDNGARRVLARVTNVALPRLHVE